MRFTYQDTTFGVSLLLSDYLLALYKSACNDSYVDPWPFQFFMDTLLEINALPL